MSESIKIIKRIEKLREYMKEYGIDAYYIPTNDYHCSEFVSDFFKVREFFSGFTGSAGTLIVLKDYAALFTDGRYFLQAEQELEGSGITLYKSGEEGVPTIKEFLFESLENKMTLGFDGGCVTAQFALDVMEYFSSKEKILNLSGDNDIISKVWTERPVLSESSAYLLDIKYTGEDYDSKIRRIRDVMRKNKCNIFVLTSLDDIAWALNIRGDDIKYSPLVLSYMIITDKEVFYYCGNGKNDDKKIKNIASYLTAKGIVIKSYDEFYNHVEEILKSYNDVKIMADLDKINYKIYNKFRDSEVVDIINPTTKLKAVKNEVEIENERKAHIKDGVAFAKFLYWFYNVRPKTKREYSEANVACELYNQRNKQEGFIEESFEAIAAYGKNGAIVHYSPSEESDAVIGNKSFLLLDTGGHYFEGTTDITRTISCGELSDEEKRNYTLVLKGNLALGNAKFMAGTTGANLDILAREPLWENCLNYNHGTGHGVGYLMNVHEGPHNIRYRLGKGKNLSEELKPGVIISNEPGIYLAERYGIRLENLVVCKERLRNEYGTFYEFETLTMVPFDLNAIDTDLLDNKEKELLNKYHNLVYEKISPHLEEEEREFLKKLTKAIK